MVYILSLQQIFKNVNTLAAGVTWYSRASTIKRRQSPHNAQSRRITFFLLSQKRFPSNLDHTRPNEIGRPWYAVRIL
jgi:hypothetical protein